MTFLNRLKKSSLTFWLYVTATFLNVLAASTFVYDLVFSAFAAHIFLMFMCALWAREKWIEDSETLELLESHNE